MTDITELAQRLKLEVHRAVSNFNPQMNIKTRDLKELVEALELKEEQRANWFKMAQKLGEDLDAAEKRIAELESRTVTPVTYSENADADHCRKWAWEQVKGEVSTEGWTTGDNITYFGFFCWGWDMRHQYNEQRTVTIEPFRAFVTDADLAALHRFAECCDDPESGGHDLEKEQVRRLEAIGALQRSGRISYITGFGDVLISITAGIKWEAE